MEIARDTQEWLDAEEMRRREIEYHVTGEWRERSGWAVDGGTPPPPAPLSLSWEMSSVIGTARSRLANLPDNKRAEFLPQICDEFTKGYVYAMVRASHYQHESSVLGHLNGYDEAFYGEILDEHNIYGLGVVLAEWRLWLTTQDCADYVPYQPFPEPAEPLDCDNYGTQLEAQADFLTYFAYRWAWEPLQTGIHRSTWPILCGYLPEQ